jgi:myo-inositol 2-dehydrogenase / D-chiro-inositol 1-dehydrogenase
MKTSFPLPSSTPTPRRRFLAATGVAAAGLSVLSPRTTLGAPASGRVSWGLIGCGGRGRWMADLVGKHGGYELAAVHDYFPERAGSAGGQLKVPENRQFSGLDGYKRMLDLNLDAVFIQSPPYFHPQQAADAVDAGKHVYVAKPVAVDVPGSLSIEESGRKATARQRCFLVDFQTRAHPAYQEVVRWVQEGKIGPVVAVESNYQTSTMFVAMGGELAKDPENPEVRLRCWGIDRVLSGDVIVEQNIHAQDVVTWFLDAAPVRAVGTGGLVRGFGTCWDHFSVQFEFPGKIINTFSSKQVGHGYDDIMCRVYGTEGTADTHYFGEVWVRSKEDGYNAGRLGNLYTDGAVNNIAAFHRSIQDSDWTNPTVAPSVRSNLTTILGRQAARAHGEVTWADMLRTAERYDFPLGKLKA